MVKKVISGVIAVAIGGTVYTINQSKVVDNFAKNTGMSHQQAQDYVNGSQNNLQSFTKIGESLVSDGNTNLRTAQKIDCANYKYTWEAPELSCEEGLNELVATGNDEITLGNCYSSLGTNLGNSSQSKIEECIREIDTTNDDYNLPLSTKILSASQIANFRNGNNYNKSVLQTALQSK